jgi:outer membrane lipoprotein carrier protein
MLSMKARSLVLSLMVGLFAPMAMPAPSAVAQSKKTAAKAPDASQIADRVQAFYNHSHTFQAGFKQRYKVRAYNKVKNSAGQVVFKKPGKMSWRYTSNGNRVVSDGKTIKVYEKDNKQMYLQAMGKSQYPAALAFLVGGGNLKKSFKLKKLDARALHFEGGYVLLAVPKKATPAYQKLVLYVDGQTAQVRRVILLDAQGNTNRFTFEHPVINKKVKPGEFNFTPPSGTQVIKP